MSTTAHQPVLEHRRDSMELNFQDFRYLELYLEGFFFGLYSGIFAMYSHQSTDKAKNILFYTLWVLYALSAAASIIDILAFSWWDTVTNIKMVNHLKIIEVTVFACCDFIAQFVLIYRCWIVWDYSIRVVIVPSFLAFAFLAIWIAQGTAPLLVIRGQFYTPDWAEPLEVAGLTLSMTINALVTGLIVFRIFKVFRDVRIGTVDDQILGVTGGSTLQRVMFILIESGMALFSIQLVRLVVGNVTTDAARDTYFLIVGIHEMLNGITPTIILVRVSMGLSFHDGSSMVETNIPSLHFAPHIPIPENEIVDEERRDDHSGI